MWLILRTVLTDGINICDIIATKNKWLLEGVIILAMVVTACTLMHRVALNHDLMILYL